jgi:hypothetical protein
MMQASADYLNELREQARRQLRMSQPKLMNSNTAAAAPLSAARLFPEPSACIESWNDRTAAELNSPRQTLFSELLIRGALASVQHRIAPRKLEARIVGWRRAPTAAFPP